MSEGTLKNERSNEQKTEWLSFTFHPLANVYAVFDYKYLCYLYFLVWKQHVQIYATYP